MKPYENLAKSTLPDGTVFSLHKHDGNFYLKYNGYELMSTSQTFSERHLADIGLKHLLEGKPSRPERPRVMIGGLGLGFTLKRTLELIGRPATVDVAELMQPIIEWNRTFLVDFNGPLLEDPRTSVIEGDFYTTISNKPKNSYDALLIDIDNTPDDLITSGNDKMYSPAFLQKIKQILSPNGCVTYWLSEPAPKFKKLLGQAGFKVEEYASKPREHAKRARHCILIGRKQ
ncbi:spermine synthase [Rubritalea spongiae]|uniref:Spermine synthase n=1 Tax=Rubritalea spongiae TaxID=430797 RepID=A0ABW5E5T8_9BACT